MLNTQCGSLGFPYVMQSLCYIFGFCYDIEEFVFALHCVFIVTLSEN